MSARISGNHHILLPVSFSVARFFPQFTLADTNGEASSFSQTPAQSHNKFVRFPTVLADKNELTILVMAMVFTQSGYSRI